MEVIRRLAQWFENRGAAGYQPRVDKYIQEDIEPRKKMLAERERHYGESFLTDLMSGKPPERRDRE